MAKGTTHISFAKIEFKNAHKTPVMSVEKRDGWVNYGEDEQWYNNFPSYLIDLFNRSPKHSAIITGKLLYILGKGWSGTGTMLGFIDKPNTDESLLQLSEKIILDYEIFDGFYVEPIRNKTKSKIIEWRHVAFQNVRSNYTGSEFYYSEKWTRERKPNDKEVVCYHKYEPGKTEFEEGKRYLYFFKAYHPGTRVYPLPNYMGGLAYIETDVEIANFNLNAIKNNLSVSKLVSFFNGIPTAEERGLFEREFAAKKTGTDNAGQILFSWSDSRERNCEVLDLSGDDLDKRYSLLNETVQQEIFTAHKVVSPMLFGVKTAGQLGGRDEMEIANKLFKANYIEPRKMALVKVFQMMAEAAGYTGILSLLETEEVQDGTSTQPGASLDPSAIAADPAADVAGTALNGSQVSSLLAIATSAAENQLPVEAAKALAKAAFPLVSEAIMDAIFNPLASFNPGDVTGTTNPDGSITPVVKPPPVAQTVVNDNIKNLTAKQHQQVVRIIRQFSKGQITEEVATTLLSTGYGLTADEIKTLLGVVVEEPQQAATFQKFNHDPKRLISIFQKYGTPADQVEVLESIHDWRETGDVELSERIALQKFATKLSDTDSAVLDYLKKDSLTPKESIATALKITIEDVTKSINRLKDRGYLKVTDSGFTITKTGTKALSKNLPETYDTFIVYHYDVAPGLGPMIIPGTRDFCRDLIALHKVFSRSDIEKISQEYGYSVWELRGGYYHNPKTNETTEYCRHIWTQEIVTKKL